MSYTAIIRSFYVESSNYAANLTSNEKDREIRLIPDIKTKENYGIALEEAVYSLITEGNSEYILNLLQDAKKYDKLPEDFRSMQNELDIGNGDSVILRLRIKAKTVKVEGDRIKISSLSYELPKKYGVILRPKVLELRKTIIELQKLYTD